MVRKFLKKIFKKPYSHVHGFFRLDLIWPQERIDNLIENFSHPQLLFTSFFEELLRALTSMFNFKFLVFTVLAAIAYFVFKINPLGFNPEKDLPAVYWLVGSTVFIWFVLYFFTNKRKLKEDIKFTMDHFKSVSWGLFNLEMESIDPGRFKIAEIADAEITADLNIAAFEGSTWETTRKDKLKRNLGHIVKNPNSIVLIKSTSGKPIGFTHVLPVNRRIWNCYTAGKFKDNDFNENYIVGEDFNPCYERPYGLIYFSAVIPFWEVANHTASKEDIIKQKGMLLEQCTAYHFNLFLQQTFPRKNRVKVLFNNFDDLIYLPFQKQAINEREMKSGEKAPIYIFEITNK